MNNNVWLTNIKHIYNVYLKQKNIDIFIKMTGRQGNMKKLVRMVSLVQEFVWIFLMGIKSWYLASPVCSLVTISTELSRHLN
jgi:hypothetical protein